MNDPTIYTDHLPGPPLPRYEPAGGRLLLPFARRQKARQRAELEDGTVIGIVLPRGTILRGGDRLAAATGEVVEVVAALEPVSLAASADPLLLARAAYHLGNRHVALEIGDGWLRYLHDHVLDAMVANMGLAVTCERHAFEPEAGAYAAGTGHAHAH